VIYVRHQRLVSTIDFIHLFFGTNIRVIIIIIIKTKQQQKIWSCFGVVAWRVYLVVDFSPSPLRPNIISLQNQKKKKKDRKNNFYPTRVCL